MSPDRWRRVRALAESLLDAETGAPRAALLERARAEDPTLARDAEDLVDGAQRESSGALRAPLDGAAETLLSELAAAELLGQRFGPYRAVGLIGEGAMGTVYRAVRADESFERQVAVKVLRRGISGEEARRRFEQERRLLARLEHPGICALLDGGATDDGLAYIVMEYVQGVPLSEWSRRRPAPTAATRRAEGTSWRRQRRTHLDLFAELCATVAYAHSRGIVHRDLKPANILVTQTVGSSHGAPDFRPKIIDFGIARVLDDSGTPGRPAITATNARFLGTLPYMAPEQLSRGPSRVDARTDIYALGVILYELLAGHPPLDLRDAPVAEAARLIRDEEPPRLGTVDRSLRGDLETIARRAMEKDPDRRYQSAAALEEDIRRCLRDDPIIARPPSPAYQLSKFVRRHRTLVGATALTFAVLLASTIAVSIAWVRTEHERRRAADTSAFLKEVFASVDPYRPPAGPDALASRRAGADGLQVIDVLDAAVRRLDGGTIADARTEAGIRRSLGVSYSGLGRNDRAVTQLRSALDADTRLLGPRTPESIECAIDLATALSRDDRLAEAEPMHRANLALAESALGPAHPLTLRAGFELAMHLLHGEQFPSCRDTAADVVARCARAGLSDTPIAALAAGVRSVAMIFAGDADAEAAATTALAQIERTCGPGHYLAALVQCTLGGAAETKGDLPEAERRYRSAYACYRTLLGDRDPRTASRLRSLGVVLRDQGRYAEAEAPLRTAASIEEVGTPLALKIARLAEDDLAATLRAEGKDAGPGAERTAPLDRP